MARSGSKVMFLTGAPLSNSLKWDEEFLSAPLQDSFLERSKSCRVVSLSSYAGPVWRSLLIEQDRVLSGFIMPHSADNPEIFSDYINEGTPSLSNEGTPFLNTVDFSQVSGGAYSDLSQSQLSSQQSEEDLVSQFYEESYAIHEDVSSSSMTGHSSANDTGLGASFEDTTTTFGIHPPWDARTHMARTRLMASLVRDLNKLPNAIYLQSITPQTVTIDLVVGIISILPPREIITRRGGRTVHLVEMLVGDDTRAGFAINIWFHDLPNANRSTAPDHELAAAVTQLRPRDIVLIRNAALSSFQGKVYGQSLRKGMTTMNLLQRNTVDATDIPGAYSAQELREPMSGESPVVKLKRVKQWVMDFIGATAQIPPGTHQLHSGRGDERRQRKELKLIPLPMDTQ